MVKLTAELIQNSYQHINPVKDRELDLRGYKVAVIENMGATLNQFDTIDLSDNDIRKVDNFPLLPRLKTLLLNNNRVVRVSESLKDSLPNLESLILTNNMMNELAEIDSLAKLPKLKTLSLMYNPISTKGHYRQYVIYKIPQLKLLDFRKIKLKEREAVTLFFKSKDGKEVRKEIAKNQGKELEEDEVVPKRVLQSSADVQAIKKAIDKATNLQEIERLNQMLLSGKIDSLTIPSDEAEEMES